MHCCFFGTDRPGVKTFGESYRCPILFTFYDTVPRDWSALGEQRKMELSLLHVYMSFGFGGLGAVPHKTGKEQATVLEAVVFLIFITCFRKLRCLAVVFLNGKEKLKSRMSLQNRSVVVRHTFL